MKIIRNVLIVLLLSSTTVMAAPPTESSIKQLLAITQAQKLVDGMRAQFDSIMNNAVQQALKGKTPSASQQLAISKMKRRMITLMQGELEWKKLEPMYLSIYKESFTEEEVAGMITFYKTPAGQAVINKMPGLMQRTMLEVQKIMSGLMPQMQKIQQDFIDDVKVVSK